MAKAVTIDTVKAKKLIRELEQFEEIKRQVLMLIPEELIPRGSKLWWEKSELEADEDIKKRRLVELKSIDDLDKPLEKLFK